MPRPFRFIILTLLGLGSAVANAQVQTQRGATFGGLAGALAGGLIGDHNNEAGAGAAIGGVVGAVAGGLWGNAADKQQAIDQQRYTYQQQQLQRQQFALAQSALSVADVVSLSRSGLSDQVIINQLQQRGVQQALQVADIITLHQQGVSEVVITSMQQASTGAERVARIPQTPTPIATPRAVIVEEHYPLPLAPPFRYYNYPHPRYHHHHHGLHIRF